MQASGTLCDSYGQRWLAFQNCRIEGNRLMAECLVIAMPSAAIDLFEQYEQIASTQQFSCLPEIEKQIAAFGLRVIWSGESQPRLVNDVEVRDGWISFRLKSG